MKVYFQVLTNHYADFRSRARRREFWLYSLCNGVVYTVFVVALALEGGFSEASSAKQLISVGIISLGLALYTALTLVPTLAITVRRMHDVGRSGRSLWRMAMPNSWLWLILNTTFDSPPGSNRWGPNPKGIEAPVKAF